MSGRGRYEDVEKRKRKGSRAERAFSGEVSGRGEAAKKGAEIGVRWSVVWREIERVYAQMGGDGRCEDAGKRKRKGSRAERAFSGEVSGRGEAAKKARK